jgi:hypothetical protein
MGDNNHSVTFPDGTRKGEIHKPPLSALIEVSGIVGPGRIWMVMLFCTKT